MKNRYWLYLLQKNVEKDGIDFVIKPLCIVKMDIQQSIFLTKSVELSSHKTQDFLEKDSRILYTAISETR